MDSLHTGETTKIVYLKIRMNAIKSPYHMGDSKFVVIKIEQMQNRIIEGNP